MRGQVAEYVLVFAAVVAFAIIVLASSYSAFPYAVYDTHAVVLGVDAGYNYMLRSFRDGAITLYHTDYNADSKTVHLVLGVSGWPFSEVNAAIVSRLNKYGYKVK